MREIADAPFTVSHMFSFKEIAEVIDVLKACEGVYDPEEDTEDALLRKFRADPILMLVARTRDGRMVGFVMASYDEWCAFIWHLCVLPEHRGKGIGTALGHRICELLTRRGAKAYYSLVRTDNAHMLALSEKAGMVRGAQVFVMKGEF
jgi:ribosomal protein S18 acetylase RimI-like enzyme